VGCLSDGLREMGVVFLGWGGGAVGLTLGRGVAGGGFLWKHGLLSVGGE